MADTHSSTRRQYNIVCKRFVCMDLELGGGWVCGPESPVSDDAEPDLSVFFNKHMSNVELANKLRDLADIVEDDLEFDVAGAAPHSLTRVSAPANIILITNVG